MAKIISYFKLSEKASMFYDPISRLKVTKTSPGMIKGKLNKKVQTALNSGHLVKIKEDEFNDLVEDYDAAIEKAQKLAETRKASKRSKSEVAAKTLAGEDEEEKKPLNKQNRDELIETLGELEDITEEKVGEIEEGTKKEIRKFIKGYDPATDSGADEDEESDEDEDEK